MRRRLTIACFCFFLLTYPLHATNVTVTDTLINPDNGGLAAGNITLQNPAFTDNEGNRIVGRRLRYRVNSGVFNVVLESTTDAQAPSGVSYTVTYQMDDGRTWTEYWVIPPTPTPTDIPPLVTDPAPTPGTSISPSAITSGGAAAGECFVWSGTEWAPESCPGAIICTTPLTELTIAGGAITVPSSACYSVDTEANTASDDLTTINCTAGDFFVLVPADNARTVILKASLGLVSDFALDNLLDSIYFRCPTTNTARELARTNGGL